ncbi:DUF742 domain-containing protein [Streptomyces sp. MCA2]|uniref:DUF742 domain-containing protein n=1 Tax=Streptomyces sp. MCA2 TaxID=2944805 RepID=UPI0035ABFDC8
MKGVSEEANNLAMLLRAWLNEADMSLDRLMPELKPEHFMSGRIPSRTTVSERLAGVRLEWEFVEAVADACSPRSTAQHQFLLEQARAIQNQTAKQAAGPRELAESSREAGARAAELVAVQRQSLVLSDKLLLAMERAVELERERNNANQMVLVLLAMVDRLQRNIETLSAERDGRRPSSARHTNVEEIHERLARSEEQRRTAEAELERARAERSKADRLAEEAAEQLQALKEELESLRQGGPGAPQQPDEKESAVATSVAMRDAIDADADDIDQALAKASRHLDAGANRLVRLADELHQNASISLDISADNLLSSNDAADNLKTRSDAGGLAQPDAGEESASDNAQDLEEAVLRTYQYKRGLPGFLDFVSDQARLVPGLVALLRTRSFDNDANEILDFAGRSGSSDAIITCLPALRDNGHDPDAYRIINAAGRERTSGDLVDLVHALREAGLGSQAYQVLTAAGRHRPINTLLPLLDGLDSLRDSEWVLEAAAKDRSSASCDALASALRDSGWHDTAAILDQARALIPTPPTEVPAGQQGDAMAYPYAVSSDFPPVRLHLRIPSFQPREIDEPLVKPYAMSGGRTRPRMNLPADALVTTLADESQVQSLNIPEHRRICRLCKQPKSVERICSVLSLPLGVARILVADLAEAGLVAVHTSPSPPSPPAT